MENKRGISAVIETVLLILIVIAAVGIIAGLILPMIRTAGERATNCQGLIDISSATKDAVTIMQSKSVSANVSAVSITLYNAAGQTTGSASAITLPMAVGAPQTSTITGATSPVKASVITTLTLTSGKQVACPAIEAAI